MIKRGLTREILLFLASCGDAVEDIGRCRTIGDWLYMPPSKKPTFRARLGKLLSVGDINKIEKNGHVFWELTSQGEETLKEYLPLWKLAQEEWDEQWRIVIFDILEKNRNERKILRNKLLSLGFGCWQESVYITPFKVEKEINEFLEASHFSPRAVCLVAGREKIKDDCELANDIWHLDDINQRYADLIEECDILDDGKKVESQKWRELWATYQDIISEDPYLPEELLPDNWLAEKAQEKIFNLRKTGDRENN